MFRKFENIYEEQLASNIIASIDQGEKWIFQGADQCPDFGGFIDRLFYHNEDTYGTFCTSIYCGELHFQIGFNTDMPDEVHEELLLLMVKSRKEINTPASVWYPPDNKKLHELLFTELPWKAKGHKTHELTFKKENIYKKLIIPENISIIPFTEAYLDAICHMLDEALSHTFDNPRSSLFLTNRESYLT